MIEGVLVMLAIGALLFILSLVEDMDAKREIEREAIRTGQYQPRNTVNQIDNRNINNIDNRQYQNSFNTNVVSEINITRNEFKKYVELKQSGNDMFDIFYVSKALDMDEEKIKYIMTNYMELAERFALS